MSSLNAERKPMSVKSFAALIAFGFSVANSQNSPFTFLNGNQKNTLDTNQRISLMDKKPGEIVSVQTFKDGTAKITKVDLTEMVDLIVEMKDIPLFLDQHEGSNTVLQKTVYTNRLMQFRSDMGILHQSAVNSLKTTLGSPYIKREYFKIFVGAAVRVPRAMIAQMASLSYVKKIHADGKVEASTERSVHSVQSNSVGATLVTQGDSVVVAIIDTGIDYQDTVLGGGFGPGFKVIGGYDFANNDANPMDDYGHGTHVAGIIAANSINFKGIAPHVKLMAFKVLNQNGYGSQSDVIAGIERATDPYNDGNFNNMVDVVNMSLGGQGTPDDALSTAVDNATKLGITFCVAAGNSGNYYTIGSPGTARNAITVGAVDTNNSIAYFSSKGPNSIIYSIKPDVVAPGVNILSTLPGNTSGQMSGTSMATPYVAGICALLKSLHRNWTPAQIKSAVMTTALDLGQEAMAQGAGRIDATKAEEVSALVVPSALSFGVDDVSPIWTITDTLWVTNRFMQSQSFSIVFNNLLSGISITATPSSFSLAHNDSQQVLVTLSVDNSRVPSPLQGSLAFSGNALFYGTKDTLHLPWAFIKAAKMSIAFDQPYPDFILTGPIGQMNSYNVAWPDANHSEFVVPAGMYDLLSIFYGSSASLVFREGITIATTTSLSVSSTEAKYSVTLKGINEDGGPLSPSLSTQNNFLFTFPGVDATGETWCLGTSSDNIFVSGFSNRFKMICGKTVFQSPNIYNINFNTVQSLQANITLSNQPDEFRIQNLSAEFPSQSQYKGINICQWICFKSKSMWGYSGTTTSETEYTGFTGGWNGKLFFNPGKDPFYYFPISLYAADHSPWYGSLYEAMTIPRDWFLSAPFRIVNDSVGMFYGSRQPTSMYVSPNGGTITLGEGLNYFNFELYNNVYGISNIARSRTYFYGALNEEKYTWHQGAYYTIYNSDGATIVSDTLVNMEPINVPSGEYKLVVTHQDYYVRGIRGRATLTTRFDLRHYDPNPPQITSLMLLNAQGLSVDTLKVGGHATLIFSSIDNSQEVTDSTKLFYRKSGTLAWNSLPVKLWMLDNAADLWSPPGFVYKADMTPATQFDSTGIDIKLVLKDQSGNSTEWSLEPAFGVGKFNPLDTVENKTLSLPAKFILRQNYPNPFNSTTTIDFDVPYNSFVTIDIFNLLGQKVVTVAARDMQAGTHKIPWTANHISSGIYFCRVHAGSFSDTKKILLIK
jgi:subtilisin family serine protease